MRAKQPKGIGFFPTLNQQDKYLCQYQQISPQVKFGGLWMSIRSKAFPLAVLFREKRFTDPIAENGSLLEGFMFAIGWHKCSMKNKQFGLYGSVGKIENAKDEWQNRGANLSLVGCILGQSLRYVGDNLFQKMKNCYNSLGVLSFDQVNYEGNIPANQGACKFASALTFTMNGFKNAPHVDKDASQYASGWWFQADKRTSQIQRDASKRCTGGK
ncbi:hypothetical protein O181_105370 [Austropuccinia psidii MF-1]|uniref:Tet-like 2OG-Fe(II) oxygenase domain-containing protein n=1 Tax=Austropuccinia psidii MF-1 TaxID=1389203 RepID=A0A9Q3PLK9_9BASI|nr:hypothetical protein [Austropuccinia psidii MF-1]